MTTKNQLIQAVCKKTGASLTETELIICSFIEEIKSHPDIQIRGFMTIRTVIKKAKIGRDISRKSPVNIPEHKGLKVVVHY